MKKWIWLLSICMLLTGCKIQEKDTKKTKELEFTVLEESKIPEELLGIVEEKKEGEFKLTYEDGAFLYIGIGYGKQETGGYSITVNELYESSNAIYFDTSLLGPAAGEKVTEAPTCPYLVVKIEYLDKPVVFR